MFITFRKWTALYILTLLLLIVGFVTIFWRGAAVQASKALEAEEKRTVLIIDPGHGGEDGGAVAADGTAESQINLAVALKLEELARLTGGEPVMTRREDVEIYDQDAKTLREKKASDLKNRVAFCNGTEGGFLVSVHQNSLPSAAKVRGAQVFYNGTEGSQELAQAIQDVLNAVVNGDQPKSPKQIDSSVYLMKHVACPAVLVECGFLTNAGEAELLKTPEYQMKLAGAILRGVYDWQRAPEGRDAA